MKKLIVVFALLTFSVSCKNESEITADQRSEMRFDKEKWKVKDPETIYAYRQQMLNDLVDTIIAVKKRRPLPKAEILEMLGEPSRTDTLHLFYEISMKHLGVIPFNAVTLVVKLKQDETVDKVLIAE